MDKIRHGIWGGWIAPVGVLLRLIAVITAQPGFLSISCGGKTNYTENNITWVSDAEYIDVGETADIGNVSQGTYGSYFHNLRLFPKPLDKSCYQLPVAPDVPYLLRLWFAIGNYSGFKQLPSFTFSIETLGLLVAVQMTSLEVAQYEERIFVSSGTFLYICFIRTSEADDPFISAIELRTFQDGMYGQAKPGTMLWPSTYDVGGNSAIRYPHDKFDRIWTDEYLNAQTIHAESSQHAISTSNTKDLPPTAVMQTAWPGNSSDIRLDSSEGMRPLLLLYFAEIETRNISETRSFYVTINGVRQSETITLARNYSTLELALLPDKIDSFNVVKAPNSTLGPILNAFEYHWIYDTDQATYSQDIDALHSIKMSFDIKDWISDPCYLIPWKGIGCENSSSAIRISEIAVSGRNLSGPVPEGIGQLTALVTVSLENNHLIGTLPNFSNLTMLERLYLQNNNLSGRVPEWLSELKNLKELNIEYNNFSGAIPTQLFLNCSLKLKYAGNAYLRMDKRRCTVENSSNNKLKVALAITLGGILIVIIALTAGFVAYRKKLKRKGDGAASKCSSVENEPKPFFYQEYSMIVVANPTNSRAFTRDEMIAATQNFSREIGRGGFGSVFFGKLPEGRAIAVKVLSLFSRQGVHEFLNEVDVLSRINHRSLVSFVGYCNGTRQVMLIYDYMPGGSLRDHLSYGLRPENSELNWKTRLKIALDAAHGLEYLHMCCTPKIIHRDVKTANILLDSNMNGKLADFGLSRMTLEDEDTHVTTAVKGTFGYMDPEYLNTRMLTEKSDVYSFGVVLLEIICGRKPIDLTLPEEEINITRWVTPYLAEMDENGSKIREIIDKRLGAGYHMKSITSVSKLAMRCVQAEPSSRPSVREVLAELKKAMEIEDKASLSEEIGIECGDLLASPRDLTKREGMEWRDNSTNISNEGR